MNQKNSIIKQSTNHTMKTRVIVGRLTNNLFYQSIKWHEAIAVWRSSWSGDQQQLSFFHNAITVCILRH